MGTEPVKKWNLGLLTLVMPCLVAACSSLYMGDLKRILGSFAPQGNASTAIIASPALWGWM